MFNADSETSECKLVPEGQKISINNEKNLEKEVDKLFCEEDRGVFKTAPFFQMRRCPKGTYLNQKFQCRRSAV